MVIFLLDEETGRLRRRFWDGESNWEQRRGGNEAMFQLPNLGQLGTKKSRRRMAAVRSTGVPVEFTRWPQRNRTRRVQPTVNEEGWNLPPSLRTAPSLFLSSFFPSLLGFTSDRTSKQHFYLHPLFILLLLMEIYTFFFYFHSFIPLQPTKFIFRNICWNIFYRKS